MIHTEERALAFTSLHRAACGTTIVFQVVRQPRSDRSNEMTLRTMHELCLNMCIAIGADTITCNFASVIDRRTRGSVYGSSVGYHVMGGVCSIVLRCHTSNVRSTRAWSRMSRTYVRGTRVINVPWSHWIWNAQRMTHICAYTSLGGLQPSKWKFPFLPQSINDWGTSRSDDRTRAVTAKDEFFMCSVGDDGNLHACSRRATWTPLPEAARENSCEQLSVWNTKLLRHSARYSSWPKCLRWLGNWSPHGVFTARNQLEVLNASWNRSASAAFKIRKCWRTAILL